MTVRDSGYGILGGWDTRLVLRESTARDNSIGVDANNFVGTDVVIQNNGHGMKVARRLSATRMTVTDNTDDGILYFGTTRARFRQLVATGNLGAGFHGLSCGARFIASTLTDNDGDAAGIDVMTAALPKLVNSICGKSAQWDPAGSVAGPPWGVCTGD